MIYYTDAHCHLVPSLNSNANINSIYNNNIICCIMSTNTYDWKILKTINNKNVLKGFGIHPWYSHLFKINNNFTKQVHYEKILKCNDKASLQEMINILPEPIYLEEFIIKELKEADNIKCIGEIGLDKSFRLPANGIYKDHKPDKMSNVHVDIQHQITVFLRFCKLAVQLSLPVSIHGVKCHKLLFDLCKEALLPHANVKLCLHSFTGSVDMIKSFWLKEFPCGRLYFSISQCVNLKSRDSGFSLIKTIPLPCIMTETDLPVDKNTRILAILNQVLECIVESHKLNSIQEAQEYVYTNFVKMFNL